MENMKKQTMLLLLLSLSMIAIASSMSDFKVARKDMLLKPEHIYNFSGSITVSPDVRQFGFSSIFSPPYLANSFGAEWKSNGRKIQVTDYIWYPSETILKGQLTQNVTVCQVLIPLASVRAFVCKLIVENTGDTPFKSIFSLEMGGKIGKDNTWGWMPPDAFNFNTQTSVIIHKDAFIFYAKDCEMTALLEPLPQDIEQTGRASFAIELKPGKQKRLLC